MDARSDPVRCPLLIGRDDLLELADRRLDDVEAGHGQFLLVAGEAGIGKTRFLDAIGQKATERGFVATGGSWRRRTTTSRRRRSSISRAAMLRMPVFDDAGPRAPALWRRRHRRRLRAATRQLVMDVVDRILAALPAQCCSWFEDLQWADDLSLEIIAELARRSRDRTVMLCGGYRTDEALSTNLRDWRSRLLTQRIAEEVRLAPLSRAETALVTTLILDTGLPAPREVVEAVYERTDGIPLHIEELLGALSAEARANGLAIREATVPDTIEDAVLARLRHRSRRPNRSPGRARSSAAASSRRSWPGSWTCRPRRSTTPLQELIDNYHPRAARLAAACTTSGTSSCATRSIAACRSASVADTTPGRGSSARSSRANRRSIPRSISSGLAFDAGPSRRRCPVHATHPACRPTARSIELYRRAVDNMPADLDPAERGAILDAAPTRPPTSRTTRWRSSWRVRPPRRTARPAIRSRRSTRSCS